MKLLFFLIVFSGCGYAIDVGANFTASPNAVDITNTRSLTQTSKNVTEDQNIPTKYSVQNLNYIP